MGSPPHGRAKDIPGTAYGGDILLKRQALHDHCLVRRELVDEGVLSRQDGVYCFVENYAARPGFHQKIWQMSGGTAA
ncbi:MAG: DUF2087 domain-containing protein [Candidatus Cloacimonetes bacterium]|nr:DUF2087 domain-containing protein [Candidatus Cloacimonadota bacterium]MDD3143366.1 DUF2087 domain-containing protein [Candidatus Cloacimonadota bacterium]MDY0367942.1 DUF2087 domain-containing protein [Candidatus Syntrophosphaera sp.]HOY85084.1 DUF2087 domain-containing protein [Candidatus Syntrophosphaera sp.]